LEPFQSAKTLNWASPDKESFIPAGLPTPPMRANLMRDRVIMRLQLLATGPQLTGKAL